MKAHPTATAIANRRLRPAPPLDCLLDFGRVLSRAAAHAVSPASPGVACWIPDPVGVTPGREPPSVAIRLCVLILGRGGKAKVNRYRVGGPVPSLRHHVGCDHSGHSTVAASAAAQVGVRRDAYVRLADALHASEIIPQHRHQRHVGRRHRVVGEAVGPHPGRAPALRAASPCRAICGTGRAASAGGSRDRGARRR